MKLKPLLFGTLLTGCLFAATNLPAPAFMKLGDIKGEATDSDHKDWIIIESMSHGAVREVDPATGTPGAVKARPFKVTKELDKASPKIMEALVVGGATGAVDVDIEFTRDTLTVPVVYLRYKLRDVIVSSWDTSETASGATVPTEELTLNYQEITMTYIPHDPEGNPVGDPVETTWTLPRPEPQ